MNGLFNTVSNADNEYTTNTGNSIMSNGDTAVIAAGSYKCSEGTCAHSTENGILWTENLWGAVVCVEDYASCILDGELMTRGMAVEGTGSGIFVIRAILFKDGVSWSGGGILTSSGAIVTLELLVFSNNRATDSAYGGGAIYVDGSGTTVNAYGTSFYGNTADSGDGDDIYRSYYGSPTITIHNTCPSPYSSITPIQGKMRMRIV
jgi:predicted outer membrane repeat protein